jgi:predicted O-methyltransferase YrrM
VSLWPAVPPALTVTSQADFRFSPYWRRVASLRSLRQRYGTRALADEARVRMAALVLGRAGRAAGRPSLRDLAIASRRIDTAREVVLQEIVGTGIGSHLPALYQEYAALDAELAERQQAYMPQYPAEYRIGEGSAFLMYAVVRLLQPQILLETGVADGYSSFFILRALDANSSGHLTSCDISATCGGILSPEDRRRWTLEVVSPTSPRRAFSAVLGRMPPLDVFVHDSDHSYRWQMFELESALGRMTPGGLLGCDDADASYAFIDFAARVGVAPTMLVERRKVFGFMRAPGEDVNSLG